MLISMNYDFFMLAKNCNVFAYKYNIIDMLYDTNQYMLITFWILGIFKGQTFHLSID